MDNKYYIKVVTAHDSESYWTFDTLESREDVFMKVSDKFAMDQAKGVPFIEIEKGINGDEFNETPKISIPLRLREEIKDEVIKYIDSLVRQPKI